MASWRDGTTRNLPLIILLLNLLVFLHAQFKSATFLSYCISRLTIQFIPVIAPNPLGADACQVHRPFLAPYRPINAVLDHPSGCGITTIGQPTELSITVLTTNVTFSVKFVRFC